jgi:hypothetical protein
MRPCRFAATANLKMVRRVIVDMTAYIVNHQKKNRIFAERERELRHAIKHEAPQRKLIAAAEKLRTAKVAVFKCRFNRNGSRPPHAISLEEMAATNSTLRSWLTRSADEIVAIYRRTQMRQLDTAVPSLTRRFTMVERHRNPQR